VLQYLGLTYEAIRAEIINVLGVSTGLAVRAATEPEDAELPAALQEMAAHFDALVEHINGMKEEAVAASDFEWAALLRDQADKLRKMKQWFLNERHREGGQGPGPMVS